MSERPAYAIARLKVKDFPEYMERYAMPTAPSLQKAGGEVLVATPDAEVAEGEWPGNWTVVLRFPDMKAARAWYESADYRPLRDLRVDELTEPGGALVFADGFDSSALGSRQARSPDR